MSTDLTVKQEDELIYTLQTSLYVGAKEESVKMVMAYCRAAKLDVMQKPVHIVPMWNAKAGAMIDVVMPGVGLYRTQASRTGEFAGMTEPEFGQMITEKIDGVEVAYPEFAKCTVKRALNNGVIAEFTCVEYWKENYAVKGGKEKSAAPNSMWLKRPRGQIAKCAQAQALRLAFPELGAAPTAEEMEGKSFISEEIDVTPKHKEPEALPAYSEESFNKNITAWTKLINDGKKTPDDIINNVSTKATLSEEQIKKINAIENLTVEAA
jgi:phage recombination protein Bet